MNFSILLFYCIWPVTYVFFSVFCVIYKTAAEPYLQLKICLDTLYIHVIIPRFNGLYYIRFCKIPQTLLRDCTISVKHQSQIIES
jgi:hypothetical protein